MWYKLKVELSWPKLKVE